MRRIIIFIFGILGICWISLQSFEKNTYGAAYTVDSLRKWYMQPSHLWPKPWIDDGVAFEELGPLPSSPYHTEALKERIALGKLLFHDPRLSGSNQISCSSCHASDLHWSDGRRISIGHDHRSTNRNTPSLENVWQQKTFFWDGRANSLEEQAPISIANPHEMNQDPKELPQKLRKIKGYAPYFVAAFGNDSITLSQIVQALADFQRTITSRKSAFDEFLIGMHHSMSDEQILGLHLFRTKARCVNCHHGPFLTDHQFHNLGQTAYKQPGREDLGRYHVTKDPKDVGAFRTPSLRNVTQTGPWFHNGVFQDLQTLMNTYNVGMPSPAAQNDADLHDPHFPKSSHLLHILRLDAKERQAVIRFLEALAAPSRRMDQPELPQ
jgi:cytochrome c peroxidase